MIAVHSGISMQGAASAASTTAPRVASSTSTATTSTSTTTTSTATTPALETRIVTQAQRDALNNRKILATKEASDILAAVNIANTGLLPDLAKELALYASSPWFTQKIKSVRSLEGGSCFACSPDGKLAMARRENIVLFNSNTLEQINTISLGNCFGDDCGFRISSIVYPSRGGATILIRRVDPYSRYRGCSDEKIIFLNSDGSQRAVWDNLKDVKSIAYVTDDVLALGFGDGITGEVKFFNLDRTPADIICAIHDEEVFSLARSPEGILAVGLMDNTVIFLNLDGTERCRWRKNGSNRFGGLARMERVDDLAYSADGILAVGLGNGSVVLLDQDGHACNTWEGYYEGEYPSRLTSLAWLPNNTLAVGLTNGTVHLLQPSDEPLDNPESQDPCKTSSSTSTTTTSSTSVGKREPMASVITGSAAGASTAATTKSTAIAPRTAPHAAAAAAVVRNVDERDLDAVLDATR